MNGLLDSGYSPDFLKAIGIDPEKMKEQQQNQGLLSAGLALLAGSGPSSQPTSLGQLVAQAGASGMQAMRGAGEDQISNAIRSLQVKDMATKREREAKQQQAINAYIQSLPEAERAKFAAFPSEAATEMFREKPESFRRLSSDEVTREGLPAGNYQISSRGKITELGKPPVSVTVKTGQAYGEAFGSGMAKNDIDLYGQAKTAPQALDTAERTREILESGQVFTGKGASLKLEIAKFGQALGMSGQNQDQLIANTTELMKERAKATLNAIKGSGLGSGQGFTDKDRQFLENAQLGNITYDKESLKRQVDLEEKIHKAIISKWNDRLKSIPKEAVAPTGVGEVQWTSSRVKRYDPTSGGLK